MADSLYANNAELDAFINQYLRPATFPVAVKLTNDALPEKVRTARGMYKHPLAFCQGVTLARRVGRTIAFEDGDNNCPVGQVLLGFVDTVPDMVTEGAIVHPLYAKDLDAGKNTAAHEFRMTPRAFKHLILAPLHRADFEPDVLIIYGNAAQMVRLIQGSLFNEGGTITSNFAGRGACSGCIAYPYVTGKCNVIIPGGGERVFAMTGDDELCFAIPAGKIQSVMEGLKGTHDGGVARMPTPFAGISVEPVYPKSYTKLSDCLGM